MAGYRRGCSTGVGVVMMISVVSVAVSVGAVVVLDRFVAGEEDGEEVPLMRIKYSRISKVKLKSVSI
jgi:hypothetical protein